jgi:ankyrin repeat protein
LLIKFKADLNALDKDNKSALMIAVINGNQPFVQALVENGADINIKNEYGKTTYEMAVSMDRRVNKMNYICVLDSLMIRKFIFYLN